MIKTADCLKHVVDQLYFGCYFNTEISKLKNLKLKKLYFKNFTIQKVTIFTLNFGWKGIPCVFLRKESRLRNFKIPTLLRKLLK